MHKLLPSFLFLFLITRSAIAQDTCRKITFQRAYQISQSSAPYEVMQTKDSGYLITGPQTDVLVGNGDGMLFKTNKYGEPQWINAHNRTEADYVIFSSAQLPDSSYMSVVYMTSDQTALQKTDKNGNLVWQKRFFGLNGNISFEKVVSTPGNAVIVVGYLSESTGDGGTIILKFDENGNVLWQKLVSNGTHRNYPAAVFAKEDTILINGVLPSDLPSVPDSVYITKMALADGEVFQSKRFWIGELWVSNNSFIKLTDDNYILSITFSDISSGDVTNSILALDQNFNVIQSVKLVNIDQGGLFATAPSHDNGFIMLYGSYTSSIPYFIKVDETLVPKFGKFYSPIYRDDNFYFITGIKPTNDSGFVMGGYKFIADSTVSLVFKTDPDGNTGDCASTAIPTPATTSIAIDNEFFSWDRIADPDIDNEAWNVPAIVPNNFDSILCSNSTCDQACTIYAANGKIYLCHVPPGNTGSPQQLLLPLSAVNHHLSNHPEDRVGLCGHPCSNFTLDLNNSKNNVIETVYNTPRQAIIYPNPTTSSFTVRFNETPLSPVLLTVFSADGKIVYKATSQATREISFGDKLSAGIYFIEIKNQDKKEVFKIVKIK